MKKKKNYIDFPPTWKTDNLRIWHNEDIKKKAMINVGKNEEIYESRIYPFKDGKDRIKVLSKIHKISKKLTFMITSNTITSDLQTGSIEIYLNLMEELEKDMVDEVIIDKKNFLTGKQIMEEIRKQQLRDEPSKK